MSFDFISLALYLALALLVWDCIEVGRNDAANLVNAVFGARVLTRRMAVGLAGVAVVLGATASSAVIETARKGIFDPHFITTLPGLTADDALRMAMTIYITVYVVDTVLLYAYSAFGMPVSTTASLVFALIGASMALAGSEIVDWHRAREVVLAIILSIFLCGFAAFFIQRIFRAAVRDRSDDPDTVLLHGPWIAGAMFTWLFWFMVMKGLKGFDLVESFKTQTMDVYGTGLFLLALWFLFYVLTHAVLVSLRGRGARYLFHVTAVLGMLCMAFAFGQNDLANCASPGLSALKLWDARSVNIGTAANISRWWLLGCGILIVVGMHSRNAQRVTRAAANTGSQFDYVALWAPEWCKALARQFLRLVPKDEPLAPPSTTTPTGKKVHYDGLRASVIMSVSASVIAFASGRGLPVSTTYVAFAAVVATGVADRVFVRGDSELKVGRTIWVVSSWFISAALALVASGAVAYIIYHLGVLGLAIGVGANLAVRLWAKRSADHQDRRVHEEARQRYASAHRGEDGDMPLLRDIEQQMADDDA